MSSLNQMTLIGNLGKDPEIRTFQNGNRVASFSVATTETWKDKATGEKKQKTEWHNVSVFGNSVNFIEKYLKKGMQVFVQGKLETQEYEKDGIKRYATKIMVQGWDSKVQILGTKSDNSNEQNNYSAQGQASQNTQGQASNAVQQPVDEDFDDEIPF